MAAPLENSHPPSPNSGLLFCHLHKTFNSLSPALDCGLPSGWSFSSYLFIHFSSSQLPRASVMHISPATLHSSTQHSFPAPKFSLHECIYYLHWWVAFKRCCLVSCVIYLCMCIKWPPYIHICVCVCERDRERDYSISTHRPILLLKKWLFIHFILDLKELISYTFLINVRKIAL